MVISGPYRFIRNPMALAGLGQGMAVAIATGSWLTVAYVLAGGLMWNGIARPLEEADLRERFGVEFEAYCREVKCWWPRLESPSCLTQNPERSEGRLSARAGGGGRNRIGCAVQPLGGRCKAGRSLRSRFRDLRSGERSTSAAGRPGNS
ncbi:MAG: isoprenylcysteine carboxylmethyltransferase family protein [Blastocatellia bacterium]|nr:isoprenylcysteine carboxylmethyltransferase family protein [Blastocatellia bacterium]